MLVLLSPSKTFLEMPVDPQVTATQLDAFTETSSAITKRLTTATKLQLATVLKLSDALIEKNYDRYQNWEALPAHPAAWYYRGETFFGLGAETLSLDDITYADTHVRVVSGLYGLLRITDKIKPYRLEMKNRFPDSSLYELWGSQLSEQIKDHTMVLACASAEYMKAITPHLPEDCTVITPKFLQYGPDGSLKSRMAFAKWSRGLLARWTIENRAQTEADLHDFDSEGYEYSPERSTPGNPVFIAPKDFSLKGRYKKT